MEPNPYESPRTPRNPQPAVSKESSPWKTGCIMVVVIVAVQVMLALCAGLLWFWEYAKPGVNFGH